MKGCKISQKTVQFDHHLIPFELSNTSGVHLSELNQVLSVSMYTEKTENGKILGQLHIMNPQHISSLHLRNLITSKIIWEKHLKQQPPHTPSQCYLVFVRGTGLHVCKNDRAIKFPHLKTKSRTPGPLLFCCRCCCSPTLGSTFCRPDDDALHQQVETNTI